MPNFFARIVVAIAAWLCTSTALGQLLPTSEILPTLQRAGSLAYSNADSAKILAFLARKSAEKSDSHLLVFRANRALGFIYEEHGKLDSARHFYQLAKELAENQAFAPRESCKIYTDWAIVHKKLGDYPTASEYHKKCIELGKKSGDWEMVENGWHGLGTMYSMMSDFEKSAQCYLQSIEAAKKWGNQKGLILTKTNLSNIYMKAKNYELARKNIEKAYDFSQQLGDSMRIAGVLKIFGKIELEGKNFVAASEKLQNALGIYTQLQQKSQQTECLLLLSECHYLKANYPLAAHYLEECQKLKTYFSRYSQAAVPNLAGKIEVALGNFDKAKLAFDESLAVTQQFGFLEIARENHLFLTQILEKKGNFRAAIQHSRQANVLSDSLFQKEKQKSLADAKFKFDVAERDHQIERQQQSLQQEKIWRRWLVAGISAMFLLVVVAFDQNRKKNVALQRIELLMKELHHRVKNNLQTITSIMRIQSRQISDPKVLQVLNESRSRLEMIAMLHQQLYRNDATSEVNFLDFVNDLFQKLRFAYGMENTPIKTEFDIQSAVLNVDKALPLALILNELITNSMKYAFSDCPQPKITLTISESHFHYSDNGIGLLPNKIQNNTGFGTHLIVSLAQQMKANYQFFNENGLHFLLRFK